MAVTENTYTGNGSTVLYSFTFPYLDAADIKISLDGTLTNAYTLANATTVQFNTAPANGVAIRIYRVTDDETLNATFISGSAIRAVDLNDNFTQNLYVTQESNRDATSAIATANAATVTANAATSTANTALSTANTALTTANTADTNASAAVATANTAATDAAAAVVTANTADTNASAAVVTANSAATDAATALSTANSAAASAAAAVTTANTADTNASAAVTTANTAATNASTALTTANTANTNAAAAVVTANAADTKADSAIAAVANALLFTIVANVAAIPGSPSDGDAVEVTDSTGIESFTPLSGVPSGFTGDSGLSVRIIYDGGNATWNWLQYFPNDPETRYGDAITTNTADITTLQGDVTTLQSDVLGLDNNKLSLTGGTLTGALTLNADPTTDLQAATKQYVDNSPGGATGGGSDQVFYENDQTVTTNYTITTNRNAVTAGPVTVNSGVTVTIPTGSNWVVV